MFERFTERARQVVVLAQDEARLLRHGYIGTEHLLLGLLREEEGLAGRVLDTFDVTLEEVRPQVARLTAHLQGDEVITGEIPFTPGARKVFSLALEEALSLGHNYIGTEHFLLGLLRDSDGVAARVLLGFDADPENVRNEILRMLSGPSRRHRAATGGTDRFFITAEQSGGSSIGRQRYDETPRLIVACPHCATPIEAVTSDQRNARFQLSLEGNHTCPGCGRHWAITVTAAWTDPTPLADPDDDIPSEFTVWHHPEPAHFAMSCFRCDYVLERVALDDTTTPALRLEADTDRRCPVCHKHWRIAYNVSWYEQPGGSSSRPQRG